MLTILDDFITGLNIISTIKSGQTLSKRWNKLVVIAHDSSESINRIRFSESRYSARDLIKEYVQKGIEYSELLMESIYIRPPTANNALHIEKYAKYINGLTLFKDALNRSIEGIKQISNTYKDDETLLQEYNTIIGQAKYNVGVIKAKLEEFVK